MNAPISAFRADNLRKSQALQSLDGQRRDAAALWWSRDLEHQLAEEYQTRFPELKFAEGAVIPQRATVPRGKTTGVYRMYTFAGIAKWFTTGSWKDLNLVSASGTRHTFEVHEFGIGYGWELWEVEEAAATNTPLERFELAAARRATAIFLNQNGVFGDAAKGHNGLLNHPNMTVVDAPAGAGGKYRWDTTTTPKTALEILADIDLLARTMRTVTSGVHRINRVWIAPSLWARTGSLFLPNTSQNARQTIQANYPEITFQELNECETAGNYGGPVILAAQVNSPSDLWHEVSMRDEPYGPFEDGLRTQFLLRNRVGGVITPYPLALLRMDFPAD